jgi:hypothetical protein
MGDGRRMKVVSQIRHFGRVGFLVLAREHVCCSSSMIRFPVLHCADPLKPESRVVLRRRGAARQVHGLSVSISRRRAGRVGL